MPKFSCRSLLAGAAVTGAVSQLPALAPTAKPIDEASFVSTNANPQYGLAAIQCLALIGDHLP